MGKYLQTNSKGKLLPALDKADALIADGAVIIKKAEMEEGDVAVVENGMFDAALLIDDYEKKYLNTYNEDGHDTRPVTYLRYLPAKSIIDSYEKD